MNSAGFLPRYLSTRSTTSVSCEPSRPSVAASPEMNWAKPLEGLCRDGYMNSRPLASFEDSPRTGSSLAIPCIGSSMSILYFICGGSNRLSGLDIASLQGTGRASVKHRATVAGQDSPSRQCASSISHRSRGPWDSTRFPVSLRAGHIGEASYRTRGLRSIFSSTAMMMP